MLKRLQKFYVYYWYSDDVTSFNLGNECTRNRDENAKTEG